MLVAGLIGLLIAVIIIIGLGAVGGWIAYRDQLSFWRRNADRDGPGRAQRKFRLSEA
jgi:hypothetical protein